jgi:hypothetical protein
MVSKLKTINNSKPNLTEGYNLTNPALEWLYDHSYTIWLDNTRGFKK